jgi:hypothetical protein
MSEYEKLETFCALPSSVTVNCSCRNPLIGFPARSVTSTSMRTMSEDVRSALGCCRSLTVGSGCAGAGTLVGADCCCATAGARISPTASQQPRARCMNFATLISPLRPFTKRLVIPSPAAVGRCEGSAFAFRQPHLG